MIKGSIVALVTPMLDDGEIDWVALQGLVDFHVARGTSAIVAVGTTGESATVDVEEHCELIGRTVEFAAGRVPVIAGAGANSTREAIELTGASSELGAAATLSVVPYYNKPTQEGLFRHFQAIAHAVDLPLILYNVPGRTGCDMLSATVERLSRIDNIVGIKEATGDLGRAAEILDACGADFALYSGDDATAVELMLLGGLGTISVTANVAPRAVADAAAAALDGDAARARAIDGELAELHRVMFVEPNPIPVKWALAEMGLMGPGIRLPLTPLEPRHHDELRRVLRNAGLLN